jgi:hypothetical protein
LTPSSPAGTGWYNIATGAPVMAFSCNDGGSGLAGVCPSNFTFPEGANLSHSETIYDVAGNSSSSGETGINVDITAPSFGSCPSGGPFVLGSGLQPVGPITASGGTSGLNSGASTLSGSVDTSTIGTKSVSFTAYDVAGNTNSTSCSYSVIYSFTGFFQPVDNLPTCNVVKAGSAIPMKFSLHGNQGLSIIAAGYPTSATTTCAPTQPSDAIEQTVTSGNSTLNYDSTVDQYIYVWKTDKSWAGTSRIFVLKLADGTYHYAVFTFTK